MKRLAIACLVAMGCLFGATEAHAEDARGRHVIFVRSDCTPRTFDRATLEALVRVELAEERLDALEFVSSSEALSGGEGLLLWIEAACGEAPIAVLRLAKSCSDRHETAGACVASRSLSAVRVLPLADVPESARSRTIAIAIAELVREQGESLSPEPPKPPMISVPPPLAPPLSPPVAAVASSPPHRWAMTGIEVLGFFPNGGTFIGGRVDVAVGLAPFLIAHVGARIAHAETHDVLGNVQGLLISGGTGLGVGLVRADWAIDTGPEIEVGVVRLSGTPGAADVRGVAASDPVVLVAGHAGGRARMSGPIWAALDTSLGTTPKGFIGHADGRSTLSVVNAESRAAIGLGVAF